MPTTSSNACRLTTVPSFSFSSARVFLRRALTVAQAQICVVVADTQPLFREAVTKSIERNPDFRGVATAGDQRQAIAIVEATRPAVVLVADSLEHGGRAAARPTGDP